MSNVGLIIEERPSKIGNFLVGRLLPFRGKRSVGPFIFIDHMGPVAIDETGLDIGPHPHIGLSTLTYLFEGEIAHRDSLGTKVDIRPGQVNWMTAGSGIVHSERTPKHLRGSGATLHGLQIWVALPKEFEEMEPSFYHADETDLPAWEADGLQFRLVAGQLKGHESPVPVYGSLFMLEIKSKEKTHVSIGSELFGEAGLYVLEGKIEGEGEVFGTKQILVAEDSRLCEFTMHENTTVYLFGGEPLPEERFMYWNFVATDRERIEAAKQRWRDRQFPAIEGEDDFVPLPER